MLWILFLLATTNAQASIGDSFGFSSRAASLGGAMAAVSREGASAYQNPAALSFGSFGSALGSDSLHPNEKLSFHWSMIYMTPQFRKIENVIVENNYTSDQIRFSNVDTDYPKTFGQTVGMGYEFKKSPLHWSFGVLAFLPLDELALVDSGETFIPEYVLHRSRNQKPELNLGLGVRPSDRFSIGLGIHLGSALTSNTTIFLQTDQNKVSTMRIAASLKTKASPYLGAQVVLSDSLTSGLVFRMPLTQNERINVQASTRAIGTVAALNFNFPAIATMYYEPLSVEWGNQWKFARDQSLFFQIDYQNWSRFKAPALVIGSPETQLGGVQFSPGKNPAFEYRDIIIPRIGYEKRLDTTTFRMGYAYRESILKNPPTGAGNYLDPSEHRFSGGMGFDFPRFLDFDAPCRIDFHVAYYQLVKQHVVKTPGDETGARAGNQKIGAPGFEAGGHIWGGGLTLNLFL